MYVLDVIALSPTSPAAPLSYRSKEHLKPGAIVSITLRNTPIHGVVVGATEVRDAKSLLKNATFALAKSVRYTDGMLPASLMKAAHTIALYHAVPLGAVLHALLSDAIAVDLPRVLVEGDAYRLDDCEYPRMVRYRKYRSIIEDTKGAVLLVVPTIAELQECKQVFSDLSPIVLSGELKPEARRQALVEAVSSTGLIIATPAFSFAVIRALGHVIIERPSAGTYRMPRRPNLDRVRSLLFLAEARRLPVTLGDYPLPLEYRPRPEDGLFNTPSGEALVVDVREAFAQGEAWKALPDSSLREIKQVLKDRGRILILASRKGYAPYVVCKDCGTALKDEQGRSYALATVGGVRVLRTADGNVKATDKTTCPVCGSWNLLPLGVGVERVFEELTTAFPEETIVRFDSDTIKTDVAARKAMKGYKETGGILLGTETVLPWLSYGLNNDDTFDLAVIASMDSLLALPFWRSRERFVRVGLILCERAKRVLIHTRQTEDSALEAVLAPKDTTFFREELSLRNALTYPPFGTLIAFHAEGTQKRLLEAKILLTGVVLPHSLALLPERTLGKNEYRQTFILHLKDDTWPDQTLSERIQTLPPFIKTVIDPESFW